MTEENRNNKVEDDSINDEEESSIMQEESHDNPVEDTAEDEEKETRDNLVEDTSIKDEEKSVITPEKSRDNLGEDTPIKDESKTSMNMPKENHNDVEQGGPNKGKEDIKKSPEEKKSDFEKQIKHIFSRPNHLEPKHPVFSSPFVRHIAAKAFGPKKPKWYVPLTSAQLYLFKDMVNCVEIGRQGLFHFDAFMEALQDLDRGITRAEVLDILEDMEKNEFDELDFGKFLFLLAYKDLPDLNQKEDIDKALSTSVVTPRQCLILSAISYYVLIASPEEITRYYMANTRRKATVLHFHMNAARLGSLTGKQMEKEQKKASQRLGPLFALTGSPYACPVPFVPCTKKTKSYEEFTERKLSRPRSALLMKKKQIQRPITAIKQSRKLGDPVKYKTTDDKKFYDMHYGRIPMPRLEIPKSMRKEINKKCTVEHKDYITKKAYEAVAEYNDRLKQATVLYNNRSLYNILKKGFPTISEGENFIEVFERYMPLKLDDMKNFSLWVMPANYERKHDGRPLYPDNFAFGKKIP